MEGQPGNSTCIDRHAIEIGLRRIGVLVVYHTVHTKTYKNHQDVLGPPHATPTCMPYEYHSAHAHIHFSRHMLSSGTCSGWAACSACNIGNTRACASVMCARAVMSLACTGVPARALTRASGMVKPECNTAGRSAQKGAWGDSWSMESRSVQMTVNVSGSRSNRANAAPYMCTGVDEVARGLCGGKWTANRQYVCTGGPSYQIRVCSKAVVKEERFWYCNHRVPLM